MSRSLVLAVAFLSLTLPSCPLRAQTQGPIHFIWDCHVDPIPANLPLAQKQARYNALITNLNWVLDQADLYGPRISFLSTGWFMEFAAGGGVNGPGAQVLRRVYNHGAQIGSHQHDDFRAGTNNWPLLGANQSPAAVTSSWTDNQTWVNNAIMTAYSGSPPEPLANINCVKGAHVPSTEAGFHAMMPAFGYPIRQGGPEEDYSAWYGHHIWNPYRPSPLNYMDEDLNGTFVVSPQSSLIGVAQIHHAIFQDNTTPMAKRQFLQIYLNWRYRDRFGLPERVWAFGWGGHPDDFDPTDPGFTAAPDVLAWLNAHFSARVEPTGSNVLTFSTQREVGADYLTWEAAHPGTQSFGGHSLAVNWSEYPYLRAVAEEMAYFGWVGDLNLGAGVDAYQLRKDASTDAVVLWRTSGTSTVDLSSIVGPSVRIVGLETGNFYGSDPSTVIVGQEPLIVTEDAGLIQVLGDATLGATINVRLTAPVFASPNIPARSGAIFMALAPGNLNIPYLGQVLLDPNASLLLLAQGPITALNGLSLPITIPNNPAFLGLSADFQGVVFSLSNASARVTINAIHVTVH